MDELRSALWLAVDAEGDEVSETHSAEYLRAAERLAYMAALMARSLVRLRQDEPALHVDLELERDPCRGEKLLFSHTAHVDVHEIMVDGHQAGAASSGRHYLRPDLPITLAFIASRFALVDWPLESITVRITSRPR